MMWFFKKKEVTAVEPKQKVYHEFFIEKYDGSEETIVSYKYEADEMWISFHTDYGWTSHKTSDIKTLTNRSVKNDNVVSIREAGQ